MKISGNDELNRYISEASLKKTLDVSEKTKTHEEDAPAATKSGAVVQLSTRAKEIQVAREALASEPDVRLDKVREVSDKIREGTYEVNAEKTAEKLVSAFFDRMI